MQLCFNGPNLINIKLFPTKYHVSNQVYAKIINCLDSASIFQHSISYYEIVTILVAMFRWPTYSKLQNSF